MKIFNRRIYSNNEKIPVELVKLVDFSVIGKLRNLFFRVKIYYMKKVRYAPLYKALKTGLNLPNLPVGWDSKDAWEK